METMLMPQFVHMYKVNENYIALFNSLTLDILYCSQQAIKISGRKIQYNGTNGSLLEMKKMTVITNEEAEALITENIKKCAIMRDRNVTKFLYIVPTVQCNLNCTYCHIQHGRENRKSVSMNVPTLIRGLDIFKSYGGFEEENGEIMYYGGEPFLEPDFLLKSLEMIRSYSSKIKITIFTNGTLITEELAEKLKKYKLYVIVSMDGRESAHDAARIEKGGAPSYKKAEKGYRYLQKAGIDVGISLVAGTHNIDRLEEEVWYLADELRPLDIGISTLHLFPHSKNPNEVDINRLTEKLQSVQMEMRKKGVYIEHLFRKIRPFVEKSRRLYDCPSCNSKLLITPWDTIGFCEAFMEEEKYFYATKGFCLDKCSDRNDWKMRVPLTNRECYSCPAVSICGGGCPYDAFCETGNICKKDSRRCLQSRKMVKWLCNDLFQILEENGRIAGQDIYEPSMEERKLLYGNVELNDRIPLQNYSKSNEDINEI